MTLPEIQGLVATMIRTRFMGKSCRCSQARAMAAIRAADAPILETDRNRANDDLGATNRFRRRLRNRWIDDHRRETLPHPPVQQDQLALPRHRAPGGKTVRPQSIALRDFIDRCAGPQAFRNDLRLDLVRPVSVNLTCSLLVVRNSTVVSMEKTPCHLSMETRSQIRQRLPMWEQNSGYNEHGVVL